MAIMHPEDIENYKYTYSEYKFYEALKNQLPDKYHVFYSVRWFEKIEDKRIDSECDFLIFDPSFGFLTVEVKGGRKIAINNDKWFLTESDSDGNDVIRELKTSPFEQAEKSMRHFYSYFSEEFLQSFNGVYGFAVCFPMFQIDEQIEAAATKDLVIDIRDIDNLGKKINSIFHYWRNRRNNIAPFSADQKKRFINMINKQISLSAAAGALIPIKEREFKKINLVQDSIIDFLYNYNQVQIVGGAGTGKTYIAMKKIKRELQQGKKVLYICKNKELAHFVESQFDDDNLTSSEFYDLIESILKTEITNSSKLFDMLYKIEHIYFDSIIVDEAQDFDINEALSIRQLLQDENKSTLYVFLDENQNLFNINFDSAFAINYPPYVLRYNIRNTGEIYNYATKHTDLGKDTIANALLGVSPEIRECKNRIQAISSLSNILNRLIQKEFVKLSSIVILSDLDYNKSILQNETTVGAYNIKWKVGEPLSENEIKFRTVAEFKGLEADIIVYLTHTYKNAPQDEHIRKNNYVGFTRPRYYLYIVNTSFQ